MRMLFVVSVFLSACCHLSAAELTGRVVGVTDGDTITVLDADKVQHKIRLEGIDAPESKQAFGTKVKQALSDRVFGKTVRVEWSAKDRYGRTLGHVYVGKDHVNLSMIRDGFAWHYKQFSKAKDLADAETEAREAGRGLWADKEPVPPWEFRKRAREKAAAK